ncbi:MAG: HNH endonuclease [Nocardioidaceae bacterium]
MLHTPAPWEGSDHARSQTWAWQQLSRFVVDRDGGICYLCHGPGADGADHLLPVAEGGTDDPENLAAVHDKVPPYCHRRKTAGDRARLNGPTRATH